MLDQTFAPLPISEPASHPDAVDPIADGIQRPLDSRYVSLQRRVAWIGVITRAALCFGIAYGIVASGVLPAGFDRGPYVGAGLVVLVLTAFSQWWPSVSYRYASYRVDAQGLEIRRGVLWRSVTTLPRSRVQHTDVSQGPFERHFGLGTLRVHTAGTSHARVSLPGLEYQRALRIREHLLPRNEYDVI